MNTEILEGIGLSRGESKVFLVILALGESKTGKIIEKSGLQSSSVYHALNGLISRGLVSYIKKSEVKYYKAADPESVVDYIELKKQEYLTILPQLKALQNKTENEGVEFFKSYKGIKTIFSEMLRDTKKGDEMLVFSIDDLALYEKAREQVFRPIKHLIKEKRISLKGIFSEKVRYKPNQSSIMKKRYLDIPLPPNTMIVNNKVAIISWEEKPVGIVIHSSTIARQYSAFFNAVWTIAKK